MLIDYLFSCIRASGRRVVMAAAILLQKTDKDQAVNMIYLENTRGRCPDNAGLDYCIDEAKAQNRSPTT